jgi:hypothetical protein
MRWTAFSRTRFRGGALLDQKRFIECLDELDRALFKLAEHDDCQRFHKDSQLTAVILLSLRCSSLLRSLVILFESGAADSFQVTLRGFEEAWYLGFYLRFADHSSDASKWLAEKGGTWSVPLGKLIDFAKERGIPEPTIGRDYGRLSEVSHPTKSAAMNSVTLCGVRLGIVGASTELKEERQSEEARFPDALCRLLWLLLDEDPKFISIHLKPDGVPLSWKFCDGDKRQETRKKSG